MIVEGTPIPESNEEMHKDLPCTTHMNFENMVDDIYILQGNDNLWIVEDP
jgi:hypothetical protein